MSLNNKIAIITGASSGIGAATSVHFVRNGASVAAVGRNLENLKNTRDACSKANPNAKCFLIQADVTNDSHQIVDKTIQEFGRIDILVNNAGILAYGGLMDTDIEQLDKIMDTNVRSIFKLTKLAIPHLIKSQGNIVNVSSVSGIRSFTNSLSYGMSKAALDQFTKCVALEMAPHGVRVNSVNSGFVVTEIHKRGGMDDKAYTDYVENCSSTNALGRVGNVNEVASAIVFLASDEASFVTGALMSVDGGKVDGVRDRVFYR